MLNLMLLHMFVCDFIYLLVLQDHEPLLNHHIMRTLNLYIVLLIMKMISQIKMYKVVKPLTHKNESTHVHV